MDVLFATDGSTPAIDAGQLLCRIANPADVTVTVLTIAMPTYEDERDIMHAEAVAEVCAGRLSECGFAVRQATGVGHPASQILRRIENDGYELVVIGAGGTPWLDRLMVGSVSTRLLHESPVSVLMVHSQAHHDAPVRIVLGTDGSADAMFALEFMRTLMDPHEVSVRVLHVLELPDTSLAPLGPFMMPVPLGEGARKTAMDHGWEITRVAAEELIAHGFKAEADVIVERPAAGLLQASHDADLVVVGSRGMGTLGRTFLGSVSDRVARHAPATLVGRVRI
jgi:nucleotide-binding universal stress UspA family protein